jgi:hypothetical protein
MKFRKYIIKYNKISGGVILKIRGDFVTNSSSTSFILTAKEDIIDANLKHFKKTDKIGLVQLLTFLKDELKKTGHKTQINDEEYYFTVKKFNIGKSVFLDDSIKQGEISKTDFSNLSNAEMWDLINWIVVKGQSKDLYGIGATQTTDPKCDCEEDARDS